MHDRESPFVRSDGVGVQTCYRRECILLLWVLGFRQSSFHLIAQALRNGVLHVFGHLPLYRHAIFPSAFRLQVNRFASKSFSLYFASLSQVFLIAVTRRTISMHPALPARLNADSESAPFAPIGSRSFADESRQQSTCRPRFPRGDLRTYFYWLEARSGQKKIREASPVRRRT